MTDTIDTLSYPYSRIYAEGWNAARKSSLKSGAELKKAAAANPHKTAHERARWDEGFARGSE